MAFLSKKEIKKVKSSVRTAFVGIFGWALFYSFAKMLNLFEKDPIYLFLIGVIGIIVAGKFGLDK